MSSRGKGSGTWEEGVEISSPALMKREAIRGEFNAGEYLRDGFLGGVGGAFMGLPGMAAGAAGGLATHGVQDLWYAAQSPENKASWQAGDLQTHINEIATQVQTVSPDLAAHLTKLGTDYKEFIDSYVQHNASVTPDVDNFFLAAPQVQRAASLVAWDGVRRFRFARNTDPFASGIGGVAKDFGIQSPGMAVQNNLEHLWNAGAGLKPAQLFGKGLAGAALSFGANAAINGIDYKLQGPAGLVNGHLMDAKKIIQTVNGLTKNDPRVVDAGNRLWGELAKVAQYFSNVASQFTYQDGTAYQAPQAAPAAAQQTPAVQATPQTGDPQFDALLAMASEKPLRRFKRG